MMSKHAIIVHPGRIMHLDGVRDTSGGTSVSGRPERDDIGGRITILIRTIATGAGPSGALR
jgi:hypothetical protein